MANIVPIEQAEPIINAMIVETLEKIKSETGIEFEKTDIESQFSDCEWMFIDGNDGDAINIEIARRCFDNIADSEIKWIKGESKTLKL